MAKPSSVSEALGTVRDMSEPRLLQRYADAVDALRTSFRALGDSLFASETVTQYELIVVLSDLFAGEMPFRDGEKEENEGPLQRSVEKQLNWLRMELPALASLLLPAQFRITIELTVHGFRARLRLHGKADSLKCDCDEVTSLAGGQPLPPRAVELFEVLQDLLQPEAVDLPLAEICDLLDNLAAGGAVIELSLLVFLDKTQVSRSLAAGAGASRHVKVVSFLFPEALAADLEDRSLHSFEQEYCQHSHRTVVVVFGFQGWLSSDVIAVCGHDHEDRLVGLLARPLSDEALAEINKTLELRESQGSWAFPTMWLTPDVLALTACLLDEDGPGIKIRHCLTAYQLLLSAIFLAHSVELRKDTYWIECRGLRRTRFSLSRRELLECSLECASSVYQLFVYAYDGFSPDKLEIARQFLSLTVESLQTLCDRAAEVRDATRKTYGRHLVKGVEDYFASRDKIHERIKTVVAETAGNVIELTREVNADVYKVAGILVSAVVGALIKPDLSLWAFLGASLVIICYLGLVIFYYLATLKQAYELRMNQHAGYIRSFQDILRMAEIEEFLGDKHLGRAQAVFSRKCRQAMTIYLLLLILALLIGIASVAGLVGHGFILSTPSTVSPLPTP
jgi:hypothetical protein